MLSHVSTDSDHAQIPGQYVSPRADQLPPLNGWKMNTAKRHHKSHPYGAPTPCGLTFSQFSNSRVTPEQYCPQTVPTLPVFAKHFLDCKSPYGVHQTAQAAYYVGAVINRFPEQSGRVPKFQDLAIIGVTAAVISAAAQLFLTRDHLYEIAMISRFGCLTSKDVCALPYNFHRARFPLQNNSHFVLSIMQSHSTTSEDTSPINQDVSLSPSNSGANLNSTARGETPIVTLLERLPPIETVPPPIVWKLQLALLKVSKHSP